jgi:hypothetical protein
MLSTPKPNLGPHSQALGVDGWTTKMGKPKKKPSASTELQEAVNPLKEASIDDIFSTKVMLKKDPTKPKNNKEKRQELTEKVKIVMDPSIQTLQKPATKPKASHDGFTDSRGSQQGRKKTDDGLLVFASEELNIGKGGDTDECPFDCRCCF